MKKVKRLPRLKISSDRRHIVTADGSPFFYLADTAWEMFHRLKREEADLYLANRRAKGFTVIQAVVLAEWDGLNTPNTYGYKPLIGNDPCRPNSRYFTHVDYIVDKANSLGIYIGLLPTWGDKVTKGWGIGPEIFNKRNAYVYGKFLGARYRGSGIIWILGGDRSPKGKEDIWIAMAKGVRAGDKGAHLITGHWADGQAKRSSAVFFGREKWLDVNMAYSGHRWAAPNYSLIITERKRRPVRPVFDGEPRYENHPYIGDGTGFYANKHAWDGVTRAGSHQVRQAAYWAMLAGACGHTYGCHDIWQMYGKRLPAITWANMYWHKAIHLQGSYNMGIMRQLFESRPWQLLAPDTAFVTGTRASGEAHIQAACAKDGSFAMAYAPTGAPFSVQLGRIKGKRVRLHWFNPREGTWTPAGERRAAGMVKLKPPTQSSRSDWVLVADDAAKGFPTDDLSIPGVPSSIIKLD